MTDFMSSYRKSHPASASSIVGNGNGASGTDLATADEVINKIGSANGFRRGGILRDRKEITPEMLAELRKSFSKSIVKAADMDGELKSEAIDLIISAIDKYRGSYDAAAKSVKEQMDKKFGSSWHCIIGEGFGFQITHQLKHMCYLYYQGNVAILLFKC